jgi:glycosyltransferase involved in cell wall biosynthesis
MKRFSLIIPVYKQEKTIKNDLERILKILSELNIPVEIIVVIDGNLDHSFAEAEKLRSHRVNVIGYATNHGKGYAVRYGFAKATGDVIGFMDSGSDLNAYSLLVMITQFELLKADILIGSKLHPESIVFYPFYRKIMSSGYRLLNRIMFGLKVHDTQVGMKIYRREVLADVLPRVLVKQFAFDIEMLAVANHLGYTKIYESPIELKFSGLSTITSINFWRIILNMLWDTFAVFYRLKILHYYDDNNKRKWKFDPELNFRINIG